MNNNSDLASTITSLVECIFRHKYKLIAFNLLIMALVVTVILLWPRKYGSEAKIWLKIGRQNSKLDPSAATGETIAIQENDREDDIKSVLDVLGSRGIMTGAVQRLTPEVVLGDAPLPGDTSEGKKSNPITTAVKGAVGRIGKLAKMIDPVSIKEEAIREISEYLEVEAERKSNVVSINYETESPELAQAVVQAVVDEYQLQHTKIHHTVGSRDFFDEQQKLLKDQVAQTSSQLKTLKDEIGIASIEGQKRNLEQEMLSVQMQKLATTQKIAESQALVNELDRLLDQNPEYIQSEEKKVPNTGRDSLRGQLYALEVERMKLETSYNPDHPLVLAARSREEKARKLLSTETTVDRSEVVQSINKIHQDLSLDRAKAMSSKAGLDAMMLTLEEQEKALRERIASLNAYDINIKQLERELQLAETKYMAYAKNFEDARIDEALDRSAISNIGIAQAPTYQEKPVSPSKTIVLFLGLATMMFGSVAIIGLYQMLDTDSIREVDRLQRSLSIPVVVSIPNRLTYNQPLR